MGEHQKIQFFDHTIAQSPPCIDYGRVMQDEDGVREWTILIQRHGFCYVDGCPPTPEDTQKLLERFAFIKPTHYGGFWDFTSDLSSKDMAYINMNLVAHTDTTYFKDSAGLQMFHLLSHEGEGGASLLVDGCRAHQRLLEQSQYYHDAMGVRVVSDIEHLRFPITAHATGDDHISFRNDYCVLDGVMPDDGDILIPVQPFGAIRWNLEDRASLFGRAQRRIEDWYDAARKFNDIIKDESSEYWEQLRPGKPLIFNNQRVLHSRSAFTGKRRLCGGYINMDEFLSRWRTLSFPWKTLLEGL